MEENTFVAETDVNAETSGSAAPADGAAAAQGFTQADIDNAVNAAVTAARTEWDAQQSRAERLAQMSEDEREREQLRLDREQLDNDRAALERERLEREAARLLRERGVPETFAARVCGKDAEETKSFIDTFAKEWNEAVRAAVDERLKADPPVVSGGFAKKSAMADVIANSIRQGF